MRIDFRFVPIIFSVLIIFLFAGCSDTKKYDMNVQMVRDGSLYMNPNVPVGKAFDQFFVNGKWKSFTSTNNEKIVEFTGDCTFADAPATFNIQFVIDGLEFSTHYVAINNVPLNDFDGISALEKILSEYRP